MSTFRRNILSPSSGLKMNKEMFLQRVCILIPCLVLSIIPQTVQFSIGSSNFSPRYGPKKCSYLRERGMIAVDCYGLDLTVVPQNIRTDIELLHATHNRIRDLCKDSFMRYTHIKYLYLDDNMISYVENGTFEPLQDLEVIRLSHNALDRIPSGVLQLPKLRKIFLDGNRLISGGGFVGAPVSDSLESLTLANCHLKELPPLESYPNLLELNVSGNDLKRILPQQLAPMCQLHWLDLSGNQLLSEDSRGGCDCYLLDSWIRDKNIVLQKGYRLNCTSDKHDLTHCGNMTEATEIYDTCKTAIAAKAELVQTRKTWLLVVIVLSAIIIIVMLILTCFHQNNKRKDKKMNVSINNNTGEKSVSQGEMEVATDKLLKETRS